MEPETVISNQSGPVRQSFAREAWPDAVACLLGLALAYFLKWKTTDLVWSLWLSSLLIGYTCILISICHPAFAKAGTFRNVALPIRIGGALFMLVFFTIHFGGFHVGHSIFLNLFFPVEPQPGGLFPGMHVRPQVNGLFPGMHLYFQVLKRYWIFVVVMAISERATLFGAWRKPDVMSPYRNVMRMHLLLFFFAAVFFLGQESFVIYAVVYVVYFFPFRLAKKHFGQPAQGV